MNQPYCLIVDTWESQLELDEAVLKANGVSGVVIRLNDMSGGHHMDANFINQWSEAKHLYRAPYFVYNPWVDGTANYVWLLEHMPANAISVFIDNEVFRSGYSPITYAEEFKKFLALAGSKWEFAVYTGQWFLPYLASWPTDCDYWWAQYPYEFYPSTGSVTLTWDELRTKLNAFTLPLNSSKVPGKLIMWQFSSKLIMPGNPKVIDVNVFYGSETNLARYFNSPEIALPPSAIARIEILPAPGTIIQEYDAAGNILSSKVI